MSMDNNTFQDRVLKKLDCIEEKIRDLCDRMTKQETIHEEQKQKTLNKRGWVAVSVAIVAVSFTIINTILDII